MTEPHFLTLAEVKHLHLRSIQRFGGTLGVRDEQTLEGAVMHPQNVYYYAGGDLFEIAAAYAFHIAEAQAFLDGNKRTAVASALSFLEGNGVTKRLDPGRLYDAMMAIAARRMTKAELATLLRSLAES